MQKCLRLIPIDTHLFSFLKNFDQDIYEVRPFIDEN